MPSPCWSADGPRPTRSVQEKTRPSSKQPFTSQTPIHSFNACGYKKSSVRTRSELILRRVLSRAGRHRVYVNGSLCPLRVLEELGGTLVDIHGQHEQQSLLATAKQLDALDAFGRLYELRGRYEQAYQGWKELARSWMPCRVTSSIVQDVKICCDSRTRRSNKPALLPDEEERLRSERRRLIHAHRLRELAHEAHVELQADEQAVLTRLGRIGRTLAELAQTDPAMGDCEQAASESAIQLKELAGRLRDYAQQLEADPDRLAVVEDRLDLIQRLKKKYGGSVEAVLVTGRQVQEELQLLDNHEERTAELTARLDEEARRLRTLAQQLSRSEMTRPSE